MIAGRRSSETPEPAPAKNARRASTLRACQLQIERERHLPSAVTERLREAGLYRMVVPRQLGGIGADILTVFRALELVAQSDGATAWTLATNVALLLGALTLPDEGLREMFATEAGVIVAGSIAPRGAKAQVVEGGYLVTGRWRFGSGCHEANWLGGSGQVFDGEKERLSADGAPEVRRFFFPVDECTILDTWHVSGMRGTVSHDWLVSDVFVPE